MTTGIKPPHCKICPGQHWSYEPHKTDGVKPRAWTREFVRSEPATVPVRAVSVAKPVTRVEPGQKPVTGGCAHCGGPVPKPERGPAPKYCKPAHRVAAHRASRKK